MGGATVVLVESALQDLMWHYARVRCPPDIIQHTRSRLQRLMNEVANSEQLKANEAEETTSEFCGGIVYDLVDELLYSKIPFVEVECAQKELERVSFVNEVLKLKIEELDEVDHLRQLSLNRKEDALMYTVHKYFEEVFLLRKERAKLTNLLRDAQRKIKRHEFGLDPNEKSNPVSAAASTVHSPNINRTFSFGGTFASALNLDAALTNHPLAPKQEHQKSKSQIHQRQSSDLTGENHPHQVHNIVNINNEISSSSINNNNAATNVNPNTMAIFSYDELASRMILMDPDLATMKLKNLSLLREMEEMRSKFQIQKRETAIKYETKIRQLETKLKFLLDEDDESERAKNKGAKVHFRALQPLRAAIKSVAEGFENSKFAIRDVLSNFGNEFLNAKNIINECMDQVLVNEETVSNQISYATEYVSVLCENVGHEEVGQETDVEKNEKRQQNNAVNENNLDHATKGSEVSGENNNNNNNKNENENQQAPSDEHPVKVARQHFEASLEIGPFDDKLTVRAKRYLRQHDITAFVRSSIASVAKNITHFNELLKRLNLLSKYATKERTTKQMQEMAKYHDETLKKRREEKEKMLIEQLQKNQQQHQQENDENPAVVDPTIIALSAATKVAADRRLYLQLFNIAQGDPEETDHEYYGLDQIKRNRAEKQNGDNNNENENQEEEEDEQENDSDDDDFELQGGKQTFALFITKIATGTYRDSIRNMVKLRFKRIAERCMRRRMLENYDSFRYQIGSRNIFGGDDDDQNNKIHREQEADGPFFSISGPFENQDAFTKWKKRLERHTKLRDREFGNQISAAREATKSIVTDCISQLPSSLLVKIVMDRKYHYYQQTKMSSWSSPFSDFDFAHAPGQGEDWGTHHNNNGANSLNNRNGKNNNNSIRGGGGGGTIRVICPHCKKAFATSGVAGGRGFHSRLHADSDLHRGRRVGGGVGGHLSDDEVSRTSARAKSTRPGSATSRLSSNDTSSIKADHQKNIIIEADDNNNDADDDAESDLSINDPSHPYYWRHKRSKAHASKKVIRFAPHIHEVAPDSLIPIAANANRQGFFSPMPPSHFVHAMLSSGTSEASQRRTSLSNGNMHQNSVLSFDSLQQKQDGSNLNNNGSAFRMMSASLLMDSIRHSPMPKSILRSEASKKKESFSSKTQAYPNFENNNNNFLYQNQQTLIVSGKDMMSTLHKIPLDDDGEESAMLITCLQTKFGFSPSATPQPCVISTTGGIGSIEMNEKSFQLSTKNAARQFVRRKYQEQMMVATLLGGGSSSVARPTSSSASSSANNKILLATSRPTSAATQNADVVAEDDVVVQNESERRASTTRNNIRKNQNETMMVVHFASSANSKTTT